MTPEGPTFRAARRAGAQARRRRPQRRRFAVSAAVLLALGVSLSACSSSSTSSTSSPNCSGSAPKLTVSSSGQASGRPDTLSLTMGVSVTDPSAQSAIADANQQAAHLTGVLRFDAVQPKDIQTTDFSVSPTYGPGGVVTGYQVNNTLLITLHDLRHAGAVIDTAASSVGDAIRIDGLSFSVNNTSAIDGQARANAVAASSSHARSMAKAAGATLGGICSISDTSTANPSPSTLQYASASAASFSSEAVPLENGSQQATADVSIIYAINQT